MQIKKWFQDGHPQKYHIMALALAMISLSFALTTTLLAQETGSATITPGTATSSMTTSTAPPACVYTYNDWGACQTNGKKTRTVKSYSPTGCVQTSLPIVSESCTYVAPVPSTNTAATTTSNSTTAVAPQCGYVYSGWNACMSTGKQTRTVTRTPAGCADYNPPLLEQTCTYVNPTGTTATSSTSTSAAASTSTTAVQCVYSYSSWGACQTNNKRTRNLLSTSPSNCQAYTQPVTEQSCVYDTSASTAAVTASASSASSTTAPHPTTASATTAATQTSGTQSAVSETTPAFSFSNVNDGMTFHGIIEIKGEVSGAQGVEYYLIPSGSNTYKYIGSGAHVSGNVWSFAFHSTGFPNGEFYLRVKVKNMYGEYGSGQRRILIANENSTVTEISADKTTVVAMSDEEQKKNIQTLEDQLQIPQNDSEDAGTTIDQKKKIIFDFCQSNPDKCALDRDTDKDGLNDIDEVRYGTNPKSADSDLDGFIDGDEVKGGFNPSKYSPGDQSDRIVFEDPKKAGEVKEKIFTVQNVELKKSTDGKDKLQLTGKGLPNSFVTIYVYSDPIVLTVKTDSEGNWTYELDKELENGGHEAYVAITDNTGKITSKSEPISFVKTAQAVTVIPSAQAAGAKETLAVTQSRTTRDLFFLISIIIAALALALATIGLIKHRHHGTEKEELLILK